MCIGRCEYNYFLCHFSLENLTLNVYIPLNNVLGGSLNCKYLASALLFFLCGCSEDKSVQWGYRETLFSAAFLSRNTEDFLLCCKMLCTSETLLKYLPSTLEMCMRRDSCFHILTQSIHRLKIES